MPYLARIWRIRRYSRRPGVYRDERRRDPAGAGRRSASQASVASRVAVAPGGLPGSPRRRPSYRGFMVNSVFVVDACRTPIGKIKGVLAEVRPDHLADQWALRSHRLDEVDLLEVNEAFAAQSVAVVDELKADQDRVNVNGGAIAIGHPLLGGGARIVTTLLHEMRRRGAARGAASMCIGMGQGIASLWEAA